MMGSTRRSLQSPVFLRSAPPLPGRSASAPFARSVSPFVRLENSVLGRLSEHQLKQVDIDLALPPALEDVGSEADAHSYRPSFASPRSTEYCCAICIELLLRPVVLSCGHRLCRGCWVRVLQGSQARAVASRTGYAVCPLGRCEVRPCVPDVDLDLESEMRERIGFKQLAAHAAAAEHACLTEESAAVAAVNAWAAAGCTLDAPEEVQSAEELVAALAAATAATLALESFERRLDVRACGQYRRLSHCVFLLIMLTLAPFGLYILNEEIGVRGLPIHASGLCIRTPIHERSPMYARKITLAAAPVRHLFLLILNSLRLY